MIGAAAAKRAPADGYTLFVSSLGPFVIGPHLTKTAGYDPTKDFDYISVAVQAPNVLAVPASSPHKSLQDVIAYEKANPNKMTFASAGNGTSDHLTAELFWQQTNTRRACAVQGRRAGAERPARQPGGCHVHEHQHRRAASRPASCARWPSPAASARRSCPTCPPWKNSATRA
jgi:hypothetical protein